MTQRVIQSAALLAAFAFASAASAQKDKQPPMMKDMKPGELITYGIRDVGSKFIQGKTIVVPTALVEVAVDGDVWVVNNGGMFSKNGTAKAHGKFQVAGLDKAYIQELAKKAQDDLIERLKGAGYTVKTWDEVKGDAEMAKIDRLEVDKDYGMPTKDVGGVTYVVGSPTDDQALKGGLRMLHYALRKVAKNQDALVLVPQYTINAPQMGGEKSSSYSSNKATISIAPDLGIGNATLFLVNAKEQGGLLMQQGTNRIIAEDIGSVTEADKDNYSIGGGSIGGIFGGGGSIKGVKASYRFTADRDKYGAAAIFGIQSFNAQMVEEIKKKAK